MSKPIKVPIPMQAIPIMITLVSEICSSLLVNRLAWENCSTTETGGGGVGGIAKVGGRGLSSDESLIVPELERTLPDSLPVLSEIAPSEFWLAAGSVS